MTVAANDPDDEKVAQQTAIERLRNLLLYSLGGRAILATIALFIIGAVVAPPTVAPTAILSLLPFMAFLAVASMGQHLVIQRRGLDISVFAIMCVAAVIVTKLPSGDAGTGEVMGYVLLALVMGLAAGLPMSLQSAQLVQVSPAMPKTTKESWRKAS